MATVTHRVTTPSTSNTTSYATGAFTPSLNDLIVVAVTASGTVATGSVTNSAGTTFTRIRTAVKATSADTLYLFVANALVTSATSQTCTFDCTGDAATGAIVSVMTIAGMTRTGTSAVLKSGFQSNGAAAVTPSVSLGSAALTANCLIGFVGNASSPATLTPPTSWSELFDGTGYATPTTGQEVASINSGFTGSTVTWGSTSATAFGAIAAEFDTSSAPQTLTATLYSNTNTFYSPSVTPGAVSLTATLYSNSSTFYAPTVTQAAAVQNLTASLYENTNSFYAATLTTSTTLTSALYSNSNTFYAPTVTRGAVTLSASLYSNTNEFYAPTVSTTGGLQTLTASLFTNSNTFFSITVSGGEIPVSANEDIGVSRSRKPSRTRTVYVEVNNKTYPVKEDQVLEFLNQFKKPEPKQETVKASVKTVQKLRNKQPKIVIKDAPLDFVMPQKTDYSNAIIELKFRQAMQRYQRDMEDEELLLLL